MAANVEDVIRLAEELDPEQQNLLIYRLRVHQAQSRTHQDKLQPGPSGYHPDDGESYRSPTRDELIADAEFLRTQPANPENRLLGKYANPAVADISEEAFHAQMYAIASEWEQELDEFADDES